MAPVQIKLTGTVLIKYLEVILAPQPGDVKLLLNDDSLNPAPGDYQNAKSSGYLKAKVFDGHIWQHLDIGQFCLARENRFTKRQRAVDSAILCREIMQKNAGTLIKKTYRGHYVLLDE